MLLALSPKRVNPLKLFSAGPAVGGMLGALSICCPPATESVAAPGFLNPVMDAAEIEVTGPNDGRIALAAGYDGYGEPVRLVRDETGAPIEFWTWVSARSRGRGCEGNARPLRPSGRFMIVGCRVAVMAVHRLTVVKPFALAMEWQLWRGLRSFPRRPL